MKGTLLRKVASVSVSVSMVMLSAGPVMGQTIEELLAQIAALQAQLLALQGAPQGAYVFTRDLTVGARGADVTALQNYLRSGGYFTANATGYFGPLTRAAVAAWQAANGVSPAAGYFGAKSRAKYNALVAVVPTPTPTPTESPTPSPTPPLSGAEGSFKNVLQLADVSGTVLKEGEDNKKIIGMEFEASGSDLRIERVDVLFAWDSGSGSNRPWRYFDRVSLYRGDQLLVSKAAGSSGSWSDEGVISSFGTARAYKMSFTGVGDVVRQGDKAQLYVAVSMHNTIDTADANAVWKVRIPENGVRAVDAAGINQYAPTTAITDQASFATASLGALALSSSATLNKNRVVRVDPNVDTNDVELINFTMKATTGDVKVTSLTATTTETFAGSGGAANGVRRFKLYRNAALVKSVAAPTTDGTAPVLFSDLNFVVPKDTTDSFVIKADMRDTEGGVFVNGNTLKVDSVAVTAEDPAKGTSITPTGSAAGGTLAFFDKGISVALLSKSATRYAGQGGPGTYDTATFVISYRVSAFGADAYIIKGAHATDDPHAVGDTTGVDYDVIASANDAAIQGFASAVIAASAGDDGTTNNYIVRDGSSRDFTLTVNTRGTGSNAFAKVGLEAIHWALTDTATATLKYDYIDKDPDWQTDNVALNVY